MTAIPCVPAASVFSKTGAVYEIGKSWCTECYKTQVLKVKG